MAYQFPSGFLWGAATAAHQVEGNNVNSDFWVLEHRPGTPFAEPSGDAVDQLHLYREDIAMLAAMGFEAYRFSIEWARVEPERGVFSKAALSHYRNVMEACRDCEIAAVPTLHHFTSPRWLAADGGWNDMRTADRFARYAEMVAEELGDLATLICTINEANLPARLQLQELMPHPRDYAHQGWFREAARLCGATDAGRFAPFWFADGQKTIDVALAAHAKARDAVKAAAPRVPVGVTLALYDEQVADGGEAALAAERAACDDRFLEAVRGDDFLGVQTYTRVVYGPEGGRPPPPGAERTQMGYEYYPAALGGALRRAHAVSGCPLYVTESGIGTADDTRRMDFYAQALHSMTGCMRDGIDVRGFFAWSLLDNFEWLMGYGPTFGLVAVDRESQSRQVKPSGRWLGRIARENRFPAGEDPEERVEDALAAIADGFSNGPEPGYKAEDEGAPAPTEGDQP
ncbi:MAG: glycoside hydrolase family 1 protein [Alphaproteobacteria bacterium]